MESSREETPRQSATGAAHVQVQQQHQQQHQQHYSIRNMNPVVVSPNIQHYSHPAASVIVQNAAVLGSGGALVTMNSPPGIKHSVYIRDDFFIISSLN